MKTNVLAQLLFAGLAIVATPLHAQDVSADIRVRGGPVAGRVVVGDQYSSYRRPARRVVVQRYAPRVVRVERIRHHHGKHWKRHGYRPVVVYYLDGRYYLSLDRRRPGVREVVVFERHGRYYRHDDRVYRHGEWDDDWDD